MEGSWTLTTVADDQCPPDSRPAEEEDCYNTECGAQYYMTAWSQVTFFDTSIGLKVNRQKRNKTKTKQKKKRIELNLVSFKFNLM
jgi:hypothetical protein